MPYKTIGALGSAAALVLMLGLAGNAQAQSNVLFIFDASGSMKEKLGDGQRRIDVAKAAVASALAATPADLRLGLLLYGHRRAKECTDIELVSPIGADSAAAIAERVSSIEARGETPIAESLMQSIRSFAALKGQSNRVVLVTDGIEECGGDPCAAATAVSEAGLDLKVDLVGFTLNADERAAVQCIADLTGGKYYDAQDVSGLTTALAEVQKDIVVVAEPAPAPEPAKPVEHFRDDFDGTDLAEAWEVINPNPDSFIVENGELLVVTPGQAGALSTENVQNVFRLSEALPEGDWTLTARIVPEFQTGQENVMVGLYDGKESYLVANLFISPDEYYGHKFHVGATKMAGTENTSFETLIFRYGCNVCGDEKHISKFVKDISKPVLLSLTKQGRSYSASAQWEGVDDKGVAYPLLQTEKVTSLRAPGSPIIGITQNKESTGESLIRVDWVKIETMN